MNPHANEPITNLSVRKSNDFIAAKYKSTLLENQVMSIALTRIEINANDANAPLEARLYPGELKRLVSDPAHIYRDLKKLAQSITGHTMFLEDGKGNFKAFSVIPNADYVDGVFIIKFNNELRSHVLGLERNFTNLELSVMTDFKRNSSFRLYELLKKEAYRIDRSVSDCVQVEYNVSELRFIIGLANSDDQGVKNAMARMGRHIDWDELFEALDKKDKKYEEWRDFQRRVIKPAQEELTEKSDIRFEYEGIREGHKVKRIVFTIYHNIPTNPEKIDERKRYLDELHVIDRQLEMPLDFAIELYNEYVGHNNLSKEDIDLLILKADGDVERVRNAIRMADKQETIQNYMGWLIKAIENNYSETETVDGSAEQAMVIKEIREDVEKVRTAAKSKKLWNITKQKDDFGLFLQAVNEEGIVFEQLEVIMTPEELVKMYADWKMGKGIVI